jgi:DNA-binding response OmpR family regulator
MRVFVVEDDPDFRELVRDVLARAGFDVEVADDGIAALSHIRRSIPDLIVLDLRMPNLDGLEVLKLLRSTEVGRRIPVVVTTGATIDATLRELASTVLQKPFAMADLVRAVAALAPPSPDHGS